LHINVRARWGDPGARDEKLPLLDPTEIWQTKGAPEGKMLAGKALCCNAAAWGVGAICEVQLFHERYILLGLRDILANSREIAFITLSPSETRV
jgi:hypothetical protein